MSVLRISDLYARSERRPGSSCWFWLGATSNGNVRIWTVDHDRVDKRVMSGPRAVWNIAKRVGLGDRLAYMRCVNRLCVNPEHVASAVDKAEIGANVRATGRRKGTAIEARRANIAKAHAARGIKVTPDAVVRSILAAGPEPTNIALAAQFGICHQTVSMIRRGKSRTMVLEEAAA